MTAPRGFGTQFLRPSHNLKVQKMSHEPSCGTEMRDRITEVILYYHSFDKLESLTLSITRADQGVNDDQELTQTVYFLQGFTFCHPCPTWLPDIKCFQRNIFVRPCYTTHSSTYVCFYKILLALKPNILLTYKVWIFNPAKTALSHSFSTAFFITDSDSFPASSV